VAEIYRKVIAGSLVLLKHNSSLVLYTQFISFSSNTTVTTHGVLTHTD
jgi:hypothetical protein